MSEQAEYKNDALTVVVTIEPRCQVSAEVTVTPEATNKAWNEAMKAVRRQVSVPGFRKGRAPEKMILEQYKGPIESEWRQQVSEAAFRGVIELSKQTPMSRETRTHSDVTSLSKEEGAKVSISFEGYPSIPELALDQLSVDDVAAEPVTDDMVSTEVKALLHRFGDWKTIEGRPVADDDNVKLHIVVTQDDKETVVCEDDRFEVSDEGMGKWMRKIVVGAEIGSTVEGTTEYEGDDEEAVKVFVSRPCKVTINAIEQLETPDLTPELAEKLGATDIDDLKAKVLEGLESRSKSQARAKRRDTLADMLMERYPFDVPATTFESERTIRMRNVLTSEMQSGKDEAALKAMESELENKIESLASRSLQLFFLLRSFDKKDEVKVFQGDISKACAEQMYMVPLAERWIDQKMEAEEMQSRAFMAVFTDKALDLVLERMETAAAG